MLYSIQEASNELKISKVTIYKKIKTSTEFKKFIKVKNNTKFISPEGIDWLKENTVNTNNVNQLKEFENYNDDNIDNKSVVNTFNPLQDEYINSLKEQNKQLEDYIKVLENQINVKDKQLDIKDKQLDAKDRQLESKDTLLSENNKLLQNMQVLLNNYNNKQIVESIEQNKKWWRFWDKN